jgi:hypothetical protein
MGPLLELLVLELLVLELLVLELLVPEPLLLNSVPASMTREPSDATAASVPAPSSAYASFDIGFPSRPCRPQAAASIKSKRPRHFRRWGSVSQDV